jgi:hypothetical protein
MAFSGVINSVDRRNGSGVNSPYTDNAKHPAEEDASPAFQVTFPLELLPLGLGTIRWLGRWHLARQVRVKAALQVLVADDAPICRHIQCRQDIDRAEVLWERHDDGTGALSYYLPEAVTLDRSHCDLERVGPRAGRVWSTDDCGVRGLVVVLVELGGQSIGNYDKINVSHRAHGG